MQTLPMFLSETHPQRIHNKYKIFSNLYTDLSIACQVGLHIDRTEVPYR